jgi:hypothetical protein
MMPLEHRSMKKRPMHRGIALRRKEPEAGNAKYEGERALIRKTMQEFVRLGLAGRDPGKRICLIRGKLYKLSKRGVTRLA